jgi:DNA polymerase (family 10)
LIIAGYEESYASRYTHIARYIENMPESAEQMRREFRLREIPQVGKLVQTYIKEIIDTGACSKQRDWEQFAPYSTVEMCRVPGLGPRTAQMLFGRFGIKSLAELKQAIGESRLDDVLPDSLRSAVIATEL